MRTYLRSVGFIPSAEFEKATPSCTRSTAGRANAAHGNLAPKLVLPTHSRGG